MTPLFDRVSAAPSIARPTFGFMRGHAAHWIALGFGSGLARRAPGTIGTLWGWVAFLLMQSFGWSSATLGWVILASLPVGWWACSVTARHMGVTDPGSIVWDEIVAFWIVLWVSAPTGLWGQVVAFLLFRYFDAAKPGPVGWADALFKPDPAGGPGGVRWSRAGLGILFDDLVAAFCTLFVIALWRAFVL
jgi:phosphatidylglycerophosphatase A